MTCGVEGGPLSLQKGRGGRPQEPSPFRGCLEPSRGLSVQVGNASSPPSPPAPCASISKHQGHSEPPPGTGGDLSPPVFSRAASVLNGLEKWGRLVSLGAVVGTERTGPHTR